MAATNNAPKGNKQRSSIFQPIGDFLRTDFAIGKIFVASNTVWISLIFLVLSVTFFLIGYATVAWGRADSPDGARRNVGLWQECHSSTGCRYYGGNDISSGFQATQAFATLALIGLFAAVASSIFYVFSITYQRKPLPGVVLFISRTSTDVFLLLAISIFPSTWTQGRYQAYDTSTQYSYALVVTAFVTELMGSFLMALEIFYVRDFCCGPAQSMTSGYYANAHAQHGTRLHDPELHHSGQEDIAIDNAAFQEEAYHPYEDCYGDRRKSNPIEEYMMYIEQEGQETSRYSNQLERGYEKYDDQGPPPQPQAPPRKKGGKRLSFKRSSKRRSKSKERGKNARYETLQPETNSPVAPGYDRLNGAVVAGTSPRAHGNQYVISNKEYPQQQQRSTSQSNLGVQPVPQQTGGVYKKTDQPANTPRRYSQTGATKLEQAPGTPNSTRGNYDQAPGAPGSTRGKYEQAPGTPGSTRGKYQQAPGTPGSTRGKYEQAPVTPSGPRGKYEQAPGTPRSPPGKYEQAPGTPRSPPGKYEQAPGTPRSPPGKYEQAPGTPGSTPRKYEQAPGTPGSTRGKYEQAPGTPRSPGKYEQAPGTPSSPRGKYEQAPRTSNSTGGTRDVHSGRTPSSAPGKASQPYGYPASGHGAPLGYPSSTGPRGSRQMLAAKSEPYLYKDGGRYSSTQSVNNPNHYSQQRAQSTANLYPQGGSTSRRQSSTAAPPGDYSARQPPGVHQASPRRASTSSDKVFSIYTNQTPAGANTSNAQPGYPTSKRTAPRPPGSTGQPGRASSQTSLAYSQSGQTDRHLYDNREKY